MNYKRLYDSIIKNALDANRSGYTEKHHIIPRSLGGTDEETNLVKLTAREHFICHYLLTKIYDKFSTEWYKMHNAFQMMNCSSNNQERYFNSRLYEATREGRSLSISVQQTGKGNSQSGTMWINNGFDSKKIKKDDTIPDGWNKGRVNVQTEESKTKMSLLQKSRLRKPHSEESKTKISDANKGKKYSQETKDKMSLSSKGQIPWNKGKPFSQETKDKMSLSSKGKNNGMYGKIPWNKGKKNILGTSIG